MRTLTTSALLLLALAAAACGDVQADEKDEMARVAALEGGEPLPEGKLKLGFPWIGKQSLICVGDAVERQIAFVDFTDETPGRVGTVEVEDTNTATGSFTVPVAALRTGHASRDEKLKNHNWLEAEKNPNLVLACKKMTRVSPTVWRVRGTWTMHGVTKDVMFFANVRYVGEMRNVGDKVVRVKASFPIALRDYEIVNPAVGSPAVAETWTVDVVLLGVIVN